MAATTSSMLASRPKMAWKGALYSGRPRTLATSTSWLSMPISTALIIGPLDWSSRLPARPSQNWNSLNTALSAVGALRAPVLPPMPTETFLPSLKPWAGSWQVAQETVPSRESRFSKKSLRPRATFSGVKGFSAGTSSAQRSAGMPRGRAGASARACPATMAPITTMAPAETSAGNVFKGLFMYDPRAFC